MNIGLSYSIKILPLMVLLGLLLGTACQPAETQAVARGWVDAVSAGNATKARSYYPPKGPIDGYQTLEEDFARSIKNGANISYESKPNLFQDTRFQVVVHTAESGFKRAWNFNIEREGERWFITSIRWYRE
ncbi:MAG: hypothetical protein HYX88_02595 [Chloroflexi bacterium]|nr:hypothetical protein [Chloroflexota bacterium]